MDNVTHSLVGLMMSRSGIDRIIPRAAVTMILAANMPDIDVAAGFGGRLNYLAWHRSYAHALLSAPVMALLPLLLVWAVLRQRPSFLAYLFSVIGVLSHLVLDWTNGYGIRMLLPFSARWLRLDQTDVVDPWILAILFLALAAPALAGLVGSEIGSKTGKGPKRGWAWFALFVILSYEGARYVAHARALAVMGAHLYNGTIAQRLTALPSRSNPLRWRGVAEGPGFVDVVPVDLAEQFDPSEGRIDYSPEPSPAMVAASHTAAFEAFARFDQVPLWKTTPLADGTLVELLDLRFGTPEHPGFEASAIVDATGTVHESQFTFGPLPVKAP
jgi:inner membrane protein